MYFNCQYFFLTEHNYIIDNNNIVLPHYIGISIVRLWLVEKKTIIL